MHKERALRILLTVIIAEERRLSAEGWSGKKLHDMLLAEFGMTEEEYGYVWRYNGEIESQRSLSRSLGGAELISEEEEN